MYHAHFRGTHYEAGFRWGSLLLKHKNIILENIPFEITQERIDYALSCLPIYEKYYHEIMEEIQGLADGQQCDVRILQAVLFSMYSMPPSCNCSCFAFTTEHEILLGRNSDFLTEIERLNQNVVYKLTDGVYSFTGNTTAFVEIEDGVNEHGLAVGLTSVYPNQCKPGFNAVSPSAGSARKGFSMSRSTRSPRASQRCRPAAASVLPSSSWSVPESLWKPDWKSCKPRGEKTMW